MLRKDTSRLYSLKVNRRLLDDIYIIITRSELASLAPSFRGHNFDTSNNLRLRTRTYAHAHIHSSPQATPPIDIEGCGLRDQRCCNVHPAGCLYSVEWNGGMERWNGIVEWWNTGTVE